MVGCCSTNKMQTILTAQFFMLAQRWPYVVKPTQENVSLSNSYVTHDDVGQKLVLRCAPNANYQQMVQQPNEVMRSGDANEVL